MENYLPHKMLIDISMVGTAKSESCYIENMETNFLRQSLWDVSKYDKIGLSDLRASQIIVVLCKSHVALGEITDAVIDYLYDLTNSQLVILDHS